MSGSACGPYPADQVQELAALAESVQFYTEAGKPLFLLEGLRLPESCTPRAVTALLHPQGQDGYTSRLYFGRQFATTRPAPNWAGQQHRLLERSWYVYSWNPGRNDLRLAQMVLNHLKVVR